MALVTARFFLGGGRGDVIEHKMSIFAYINYKYFVNKKGTIYGNRLPRGTQVKKKKVGNH